MKIMNLSALCAIVALTVVAGEYEVFQSSSSCPCGWTEYYDRCFLYVPKATTWSHAQKNCQSMNANLASPRNLEEYEAIQNVIFIASKGTGSTWIGGSDAQQEGLWFWIDGTPFTYTNWCHGQPDNFKGNQDCIQMNFSAGKCWDDVGCQALRPSVCAKKI